MKLWEFVKHGFGGTAAIASTEKYIAHKLKKKGVEGVEYDKKLAGAVGVVGGGFLGYYLGEMVGNHTRDYSGREKIVSTIVGAASGGAAGVVIGNYIGLKREYEKELALEEKERKEKLRGE